MRPGSAIAALASALVVAAVPVAAQQLAVAPAFSVWDVEIGGPVAALPEMATGIIACGTNGGPPSVELARFEDFTTCPAEPGGLHEVQFTYDDEQDYIARALNVEYEVAQGGTSIFAHPVILSVLIDDGGVVRGIRVVTDDRAAERERRSAVALATNLKGRYASWGLACEDIPPRAGETPFGNIFIHERCTGAEAELGQTVTIEASYFRKRGQERLNEQTQRVNPGYYASGTRLELMAEGAGR